MDRPTDHVTKPACDSSNRYQNGTVTVGAQCACAPRSEERERERERVGKGGRERERARAAASPEQVNPPAAANQRPRRRFCSVTVPRGRLTVTSPDRIPPRGSFRGNCRLRAVRARGGRGGGGERRTRPDRTGLDQVGARQQHRKDPEPGSGPLTAVLLPSAPEPPRYLLLSFSSSPSPPLLSSSSQPITAQPGIYLSGSTCQVK